MYLVNMCTWIKKSQEDVKESAMAFSKNFRGTVLGRVKRYGAYLRKVHSMTAEKAEEMLKLPDWEESLEGDAGSEIQDEFIQYVLKTFQHTSFPWLRSDRIKRAETLLKYMKESYPSMLARRSLLATNDAWEVHIQLSQIILKKSKGNESWKWWDGIVRRPKVEMYLDLELGAEALKKETPGNTAARVAEYLQVREDHDATIQKISKLIFSKGLGMGPDGKAIPAVHEAAQELFSVSPLGLFLSGGTTDRRNSRQELLSHSVLHVKRIQMPTMKHDIEDIRAVLEEEGSFDFDLPPKMSDKETKRFYKHVASGSRLADLSSRPTYRDDAGKLWNDEVKRNAKKDKQREVREHRHNRIKAIQAKEEDRRRKIARQGKHLFSFFLSIVVG